MGVIVQEGFDGVTPPAMPAAWTTGSGIGTQATHYASSPNAVENTVDSSTNIAYYGGADDGNGGDAQVTVTWLPGVSAVGGFHVRVLYLFVRMITPSTSIATMSSLYLYYDTLAGTIVLGRAAGGSLTNYASLTKSAIASTGDTLRVIACATGTTLKARIQRVSDWLWLAPSGSYQSAPVDFLAATVSGTLAAGYSGIGMQRSDSGSLHYIDDFRFETAPVAAKRRRGHATYI